MIVKKTAKEEENEEEKGRWRSVYLLVQTNSLQTAAYKKVIPNFSVSFHYISAPLLLPYP